MMNINEITLNTPLELKNLKKFIFRFSEFEINNNFWNHFKINTINIDKGENLEEIRFPFYFEYNNIFVLNKLKKISIDLIETNNIKFLNLILNCKNLKDLFLSFLLPFHNFNILKYLYDNIKNIRKLECELHYNIIDPNYEFEANDEQIKEKLKLEKEYINQINELIKSKKLIYNYFEQFYVLPKDDDYEDFRKLKYNEKLEKLKDFPIIQKYGNISLENQFLYNKMDFKEEEKLLKDYFGINYNYDIN